MKVPRIRPSILMGELVLGAIAIILALGGQNEGAIGVAGIIGTTMHKLVESEEKGNLPQNESHNG